MTIEAGSKIRIVTSPYFSPQLRAGETGKVLEVIYHEQLQGRVAIIELDNGWCGLSDNRWGFPIDNLAIIE
jgi:hypothetical protein